MGPIVKFCGLTRMEDVLAAHRVGAWALGFIFAPSPRRVTAGHVEALLNEVEARIRASVADERIVSPAVPGPLTVGVFGDADPEEVAAVVRSAGVDVVQLHGPSSPDLDLVRQALKGWRPPLRLASRSGERAYRLDTSWLGDTPLIIRVVGVSPDEHEAARLRRRLVEVCEMGALPLIDTKVDERMGGTGRSVSWPLVAEAADGLRFLLAGGIGPKNVREALSVSGAWGVDVSSGVESAPGQKDRAAMMQLMLEAEKGIRTRRLQCPRPPDTSGRTQEGSRS